MQEIPPLQANRQSDTLPTESAKRMTAIAAYLQQIESAYAMGNANEHTYRPALKTFLESLEAGIVATNEPKRIKCGAPDYILTKGQTPLGYVEAKDIGKRLDEVESDEQLKRYRNALPNLILTDYLEFRWYVGGEHRLTARLGSVVSKKIRADKSGFAEVEDLLKAFVQSEAPTVSNPHELAQRMAHLAKLICEIIAKAIAAEDEKGELHQQMEGFRKTLLHDLTQAQFADMYAQTIAYGLFAARCNVNDGAKFTREHAAYDLPKTNPFLRKMFAHLAGVELDDRLVWAVDDLTDLLARADIAAILADFGKKTKQEDPVVHFYETFLAAYDSKMRQARGVYYTPEPVVSYLVRSVDAILKRDFNLPQGLADSSKVTVGKGKTSKEVHRVQILDPSTGTATFLYGVIGKIHESFANNRGMWNGYVRDHLLPRVIGFELLMAPYTVAHMKLGLLLRETGYTFESDERLRIYLTNTLEDADGIIAENLFANYISEEAKASSDSKFDNPVMVVIGNPPYSGHSANNSEWIAGLLRGKDTRSNEKTGNYFEVDGKPLGERNPKYLNDDYVKFMRFAQWRIEKTGYGVLAFITNHGYLDNPTFRGMRQSLMETFDDIRLLNLHGNSKKKERAPDGGKDENVFDIQQGVSICLMT
ncbi:MAG: N-6 DNA methylase, partial [Armatimonadetes bacterium]|nr:N-6 DNA methylase [Armatimonadota bacterium]